MGRCVNQLRTGGTSTSVSGNILLVSSNKSDGDGSYGTAHVLPRTDSASDLGYVLDTSNTCTNDDSDNVQHPIPAYIDDFMTKAYDGTYFAFF